MNSYSYSWGFSVPGEEAMQVSSRRSQASHDEFSLDSRVARIESDISYLKRDVAELKADVKDMRNIDIKDIRKEMNRNFFLPSWCIGRLGWSDGEGISLALRSTK